MMAKDGSPNSSHNGYGSIAAQWLRYSDITVPDGDFFTSYLGHLGDIGIYRAFTRFNSAREERA